jgi:transposase
MGHYLQTTTQNQVRALLALGWSYRRIERETGVRRETVARYDPKAAKVITGSGAKPARVITGSQALAWPYAEVIEAGLSRGLTAQRIWQDLVELEAYPHSYQTVQRFARGLKRRRPEVADVMEHPAGEEAQMDFVRGAPTLDATGHWRRPWVMRITLSCSKHGYAEALFSQDQMGLLRAMERAFAFFGGVPRVIRVDNFKAAVARACLYDPDLSQVFEAFAKHWGFIPLPSRPYHPQENGIAENSGGYVKSNALKGRRFDSLEAHNRFLDHWNRTVAQLRIHGTTRRQVLTHFLEVEKPLLQPLADSPFRIFKAGTRSVHPDGHIEVDTHFYSVPHHLFGQQVRVHWDEHLVRVYAAGKAVSVHLYDKRPGYSTSPEHRPAHKPARQAAYQELLLTKAERIGERTLAWAKAAVEERDVRAYRLLQGVISLTRTHPKERVDWACGVALQSRAFRYRTVRRLAEQAAESQSGRRRQLLQEHEVIRDLGQYAVLA